jgi:hypothetical protein
MVHIVVEVVKNLDLDLALSCNGSEFATIAGHTVFTLFFIWAIKCKSESTH